MQKLDRWVKRPAKIVAFAVGITSLLSNTLGLTLISDIFFFADTDCKLLGLALYATGVIGMAVSPIIYTKVLNCRKRENAFDVIELVKEIIKKSEPFAF